MIYKYKKNTANGYSLAVFSGKKRLKLETLLSATRQIADTAFAISASPVKV